MCPERLGWAWLLASLVACAARAPRPAGAALVEVRNRRQVAGEYHAVGEVRCRAQRTDRSLADNRAACLGQLRERAVTLSADAIVLEAEETGAPSCAACLQMRARAYQRLLPWRRAVPATTRGAVYVAARLTTGTGFAIGPDGEILTALHVVDESATICVSFEDGRHALASVVSRFPERDLALLKVDSATAQYLTLADAASVAVGQRVWTLGYPMVNVLGREPKFTDGTVSALSGMRDLASVLQINVPIQPGNSGGPLLTEQGLVVGVITSTVAALPFLKATGSLPQGINYAVKLEPRLLLKDVAPAAPKATPLERARAAVCLIEASSGDGLLLASTDFGADLSPKSMAEAVFGRLREQCSAGNPQACLSLASTVLQECAGGGGVGCRHARFAKTLLRHACARRERDACEALARERHD